MDGAGDYKDRKATGKFHVGPPTTGSRRSMAILESRGDPVLREEVSPLLSVEAEGEAARIAACREILDRAFGRPPQAVQVSGDGEHREPEAEPARTWRDRAMALGLFIAKIEQERALEQQSVELNLASPERDHD